MKKVTGQGIYRIRPITVCARPASRSGSICLSLSLNQSSRYFNRQAAAAVACPIRSCTRATPPCLEAFSTGIRPHRRHLPNMSKVEYGRLSGEGIALEDRRSPLPPRFSEDDSGSEVSYHDNLQDEPFDEKDRRFQDEPNMEDGDGQGFVIEPRRVSRGCYQDGRHSMTE